MRTELKLYEHFCALPSVEKRTTHAPPRKSVRKAKAGKKRTMTHHQSLITNTQSAIDNRKSAITRSSGCSGTPPGWFGLCRRSAPAPRRRARSAPMACDRAVSALTSLRTRRLAVGFLLFHSFRPLMVYARLLAPCGQMDCGASRANRSPEWQQDDTGWCFLTPALAGPTLCQRKLVVPHNKTQI